MKELSKSEIYTSVRAFLDELGENDAEFILSDKDSSELNTIIDKVTPLSVRNVHIGAPYRMLEGEDVTSDSNLVVDGMDVGHILLDDDFLRLVKVRIGAWKVPVTEVITEDSPEYRMQQNPYTRGTTRKPVCALVYTADDEGVLQPWLELYVCPDSGDNPTSVVILREPKWEEENKIKVCPKLENSILMQITGQVLLALGEEQRAQTFLSLSTNYSQ